MVIQSIDKIRDMVIDICEKEYGPVQDSRYYIVNNTSAEEVSLNIINKMSDRDAELGKTKYLDMSAYVLQNGNDVFVSIS